MATYTGNATSTVAALTGTSTYGSIPCVNAVHHSGGNAVYAMSSGVAIIGQTSSTVSSWGAVYGQSSSNASGVYGLGKCGVTGVANQEWASGIYGDDGNQPGSVAATFNGDVNIAGNLSKSGGGFKIDHPLDPANQYLEHSFVESPERKNVYDGVGAADTNGELVVVLPDYFEALNDDVRYQLTAIGRSAPELHVKQEVQNGRLVIAGAAPGQKISWQVTGIRKDPWAKANPILPESKKPDHELGLFRHPEVHGAPADKAVTQRHAPTPSFEMPEIPPPPAP